MLLLSACLVQLWRKRLELETDVGVLESLKVGVTFFAQRHRSMPRVLSIVGGLLSFPSAPKSAFRYPLLSLAIDFLHSHFIGIAFPFRFLSRSLIVELKQHLLQLAFQIPLAFRPKYFYCIWKLSPATWIKYLMIVDLKQFTNLFHKKFFTSF